MIRIENFQIYTGPCKSCPPGVEPWIRQFCRLNSWYVPIDNDWAGDWFNQYGIGNNFDDFDAAIELITDQHSNDWNRFNDERIISIQQQALKIYGMLHARWICQPKGMSAMKDKYEKGVFGKCIRYLKEQGSSPSKWRQIPYRESKLTHLFKNFFEPTLRPSRAAMIINVSPAMLQMDDTVFAMQFAASASLCSIKHVERVIPPEESSTTDVILNDVGLISSS